MPADNVFAGSVPELYETHLVPLIFQPYADDLKQRVASLNASRILEIAAGTGVVTRALASLPSAPTTIVATDLNQAMLDRAAMVGTGRPVTWRQADAMALPFPDGEFDAVVCQFGAMFFPDRAKAFAEARRVLRPGGRLVLCDMMFSLSLQRRDRRLLLAKLRAIAARGPAGLLRIMRNAGRVANGTWERPAPPETWLQILRERHFADVRVQLLHQEAGLVTARRP